MARAPDGVQGAAAPPGLDSVIALCERICAADPRLDADILLRAGRLAAEAHAPQARQNGEPYIIHPVAVAEILAGYRMDTATIATALLHDVVEDTPHSLSEIEARFGPEIARLVDGVTKLSRIEVQSERTKQAENLRKLLLALSEDLRVLLVKLADRLHNMRTLSFVPKPEKRQRTARETLEIYAPLAERIGMEQLKNELETLAFRELNPDGWASIAQRLTWLRGRSGDMIAEIEEELRQVLALHEVPVVEVQGREKSPYSIWRKMQAKNVTFEGLSDVMAFRIIVPERAHCYLALGAIHDAFKVLGGRFKDYISTPKSNGYQSLHTGVLLPGRRADAKIEVQIRTREMHAVAEYGLAAHWAYKQGNEAPAAARSYPWVRALIDILETETEADEAMEATKLELHRDLVFCFSPKGDLMEMPQGATPVDFAYHVHSQVGDSTVGARVNGRIVRLDHKLENGDQVEIITAKGGKPNPAWMKFVKSGKAQARIRRYAQAEEKARAREEGRTAIVKAFRQNGLECTDRTLEAAAKVLRQPSLDELYHAVASASLSARDVVHAASPELRGGGRPVEPLALVGPRGRLGPPAARPGMERRRLAVPASPITGIVAGMQLHFAHCCHPVPGDRITGVVTTGKGVTVHRNDCHMLENFAATPERLLDVEWEAQPDAAPPAYVARIAVAAVNGPQLLSNVANAVVRQKAGLTNLRLGRREQDECELSLDVEVRDTRHLAEVMGVLRACEGVMRVDRTRG